MTQIKQRTGSELVASKIEKYKLKFTNEQINFTGTDEQLLFLFQAEEAYGFGVPIISDYEFDELAKETGYEQSLRDPKSSSGRNWVKMAAPLVSLRKVNSVSDLKEFLDGFQDGTQFYIEPKLDGMTFNAVYKREGNKLVLKHITSRGDGRLGLELHAEGLKGAETPGLPKVIDDKWVNNIPGLENENGEFSIRGEAIIMKGNPLHEGKLLRSVAAGMMNRKVPYMSSYVEEWINKYSDELFIQHETVPVDISPVIAKGDGCAIDRKAQYSIYANDDDEITILENDKENFELSEALYRKNTLTFVTFSIANNGANTPSRAILEMLADAGIITISSFAKLAGRHVGSKAIAGKNCASRSEVLEFVSLATPRHNDWPFPIDGLVIKPVHTSMETQGLTASVKFGKVVYPHHPKDQIAYKFPPKKIQVKIVKIHLTTTSLDNVTCSAELDKTYKMPNGLLVSRVNIYNENWLAANPWIYEGATVHMHLSNDVISVFSEIK